MGIDPVTMMIVSAASQAIGGFMQYSEQKKADKANKRAYEESVRIAREQGELDKQEADRAARLELEDSQKHAKLQQMLYLKSGVDLTGSPLLVMEETRAKGEENAKNVRDSAASRANLAVQSAAANKPVKRASLIGTMAETAAGISGSYNDYTVLKKQLA